MASLQTDCNVVLRVPHSRWGRSKTERGGGIYKKLVRTPIIYLCKETVILLEAYKKLPAENIKEKSRKMKSHFLKVVNLQEVILFG